MKLLKFETSIGEITAYEIYGERYFKAVETATLMGYGRPREAVNKFCVNVETIEIPTNGGWQPTKMIQGKDFCRLMMNCQSDLSFNLREDFIEKYFFQESLIQKHSGLTHKILDCGEKLSVMTKDLQALLQKILDSTDELNLN